MMNPFRDIKGEVDSVERIGITAGVFMFVVGVSLVVLVSWLMTGCSTRTLLVAPDGTVNATVTAFGYCPEATSITAGKVKMISEASGVGAVVTEVLRP